MTLTSVLLPMKLAMYASLSSSQRAWVAQPLPGRCVPGHLMANGRFPLVGGLVAKERDRCPEEKADGARHPNSSNSTEFCVEPIT